VSMDNRGGPFKGAVTEGGEQWIPYQPGTLPTPAFPEFVSGHSIFSAAAGRTPLAEKGYRGKGWQPLFPPQHTVAAEREQRSDSKSSYKLSGRGPDDLRHASLIFRASPVVSNLTHSDTVGST
jgi:hypothetical protein